MRNMISLREKREKRKMESPISACTVIVGNIQAVKVKMKIKVTLLRTV